jgi:hypothetical protein
MPMLRSSCTRTCPGIASSTPTAAHDRQGFQVSHQSEVIALRVHAIDLDRVDAGDAAVDPGPVARGQRIGAFVDAGGDHAARVDVE